jgi:uncharacterized protein YqhQ
MTKPTPEHKLRLGGMALGNGLLVHGPTHWAAAVRDSSGQIEVASGPKPELAASATERIPGLRGVTKLAEAIAVIPLVKRALPAARMPMQDPKTLGAMAAAALVGQTVRRRGAPGRTFGREAAVAGIGLLPALMALRGGDLAAYHGVEHKAIAAYEDDASAADASKEHDRCGSNLVAPLLASAVAGNVAVRRAGLRGPVADGAVALGSIGVAVELFALAERHPDSGMAKAVRRPGFEIQRVLGTREPTGDQLEVGEAALAEIVRVEAPTA